MQHFFLFLDNTIEIAFKNRSVEHVDHLSRQQFWAKLLSNFNTHGYLDFNSTELSLLKFCIRFREWEPAFKQNSSTIFHGYFMSRSNQHITLDKKLIMWKCYREIDVIKTDGQSDKQTIKRLHNVFNPCHSWLLFTDI